MLSLSARPSEATRRKSPRSASTVHGPVARLRIDGDGVGVPRVARLPNVDVHDAASGSVHHDLERGTAQEFDRCAIDAWTIRAGCRARRRWDAARRGVHRRTRGVAVSSTKIPAAAAPAPMNARAASSPDASPAQAAHQWATCHARHARRAPRAGRCLRAPARPTSAPR